ncbi:sensor histidine kinase [Streptomyces sp. QHH-9511]|uniref:sensor histidine kinase n=1 Tax=Streptomyces sp. QHH-9511 TaxID=2684468 RepID=UPI001315BDB6|nr:sensor histidine kinase [Streptomyces sp. QHH-9511]QGZ51102.1 sensor histidine kinase [Streptomyces sp. QHH-9511]
MGEGTRVATTVEERWQQFFRWGPYGLLGIATVVAAVAADLVMDGTEKAAAAVLVPAALLLQLWWGVHQRRRPAETDEAAEAGETDETAETAEEAVPRHPAPLALIPGAPGPASAVYFTLRATLAFVLTWLNPFFAVYACVGYFDAVQLLPRHAARAGLLFTAVTMAGSQSGGLPPVSVVQWIGFGGLFALNAGLAVGFSHLGAKEAEKAAERAAALAELARANARLERARDENAALQAQLLLQAREAGVADERRRLAAEIHDTIAQGLTGIIAQLQVVAATPDPDVARVHLQRAADLARHSLGEARRSVQNLSPAALEHDTLPEALEKTVAQWSERTGISARFTVTGTEEPLHDEVAATLLRIAQEALANAERHSGASRAGVTLSYMGDEITLDVRDDGMGFDPAAVPARTGGGGFGLDGMRARAERLTGSVALETGPGEGTAISARVPLVRHG